MNLKFDQPITNHRFTLKCMPKTDENQQITDLKVEVLPKQSASFSNDSFGNVTLNGFVANEHAVFSVDVQGCALTGINAVKPLIEEHKIAYYKYASQMTKPTKTLESYFSAFDFVSEITNLEKTIKIMNQLFLDFKYEKAVTTVETTAGEAFDLGRGVCQDFSHILIALCKMQGIAARYVAGILLEENFTHAWVEIFEKSEPNSDLGYWIAVDPTNNLVVDDQHIKFSSGRDSKDCLINKGIFYGSSNQIQTITMQINEA